MASPKNTSEQAVQLSATLAAALTAPSTTQLAGLAKSSGDRDRGRRRDRERQTEIDRGTLREPRLRTLARQDAKTERDNQSSY